jgi:hypothetical protein
MEILPTNTRKWILIHQCISLILIIIDTLLLQFSYEPHFVISNLEIMITSLMLLICPLQNNNWENDIFEELNDDLLQNGIPTKWYYHRLHNTYILQLPNVNEHRETYANIIRHIIAEM